MTNPAENTPATRVLSPYVVLAIALLLPGLGYTASGNARRGLTMQLFMISLAFVTWHLTTPVDSVIGRLSGGLFIYALSIPESYRLARLRQQAAARAPREDADGQRLAHRAQ